MKLLIRSIKVGVWGVYTKDWRWIWLWPYSFWHHLHFTRTSYRALSILSKEFTVQKNPYSYKTESKFFSIWSNYM